VASTIDVGNLVVRIIADAKQLEAGLAQAGSDLNKFDQQSKQAMSNASKAADSAGTAMTRLIGRLGAAVAAYVSVNTAVQAFNNAVENVTALDNLSQATGVSIERLSELRNVALATGTDFGVLSQALAQFPTRMTEALASPVSKGSQALRALGVDVRDASGNLRSMDELLPEFADKFALYANGSNKAALASALFGEEAGPKMLRLLNQGKAGLEEISRTLGSTYNQADVERVRAYHEALASVQVVFEKMVIALVGFAGNLARSREVLPGAADAVDRLTEAVTRQESRVRSLNDAIESSIRLRGRA
jgi:TP901 family phage tail tape measure protein